MITGEVKPTKDAVIRVVCLAVSSIEIEIEAVIDTGFTDYLTITHDLLVSIAHGFDEFVDVTLADGSVATIEALS